MEHVLNTTLDTLLSCCLPVYTAVSNLSLYFFKLTNYLLDICTHTNKTLCLRYIVVVFCLVFFKVLSQFVFPEYRNIKAVKFLSALSGKCFYICPTLKSHGKLK